MASEGFQFKQFYIAHDRCAMKVGTDGVLLGCWAITPPYPSPQGRGIRILDVGTGSGLIARMLMQRFPEAEVEGIDIDEAAVEQARGNGVNAHLSRLQDWRSHSVPSLERVKSSARSDARWSSVEQPREGFYSLVVSNPPYFQNSLKNPDKGRELARHTDTLSYEELLYHSARLLSEHGRLAIILPAEAEQDIRALAAQHSLYLTRVTRVYSKETKPARRVLLLFEKSEYRNTAPLEDRLVLEDDKGTRSAAYQEITKDFYL